MLDGCVHAADGPVSLCQLTSVLIGNQLVIDYGEDVVKSKNLIRSRVLLVPILLCLSMLQALAASNIEGSKDLDSTVTYLIDYVSGSDVTFVRNTSHYSASDAADHIRKKYRHFRDEIDSPEKFIELCATRSLLTGRKYQVINAAGEELPAGRWMNTVLAEYRMERKRGFHESAN